MEKIKKVIILIIIIIFVIILSLLLLLKNANNKNELSNEEYVENSEELIPEQDDNGYIDVSDSNLFYSVLNSVNKYIDIMKYNFNTGIDEDELYKYYDIDQEYLFNIKSETQRIEAVYSLLDEKYKDNNKISVDNIKQFIYPVNENAIIIPIKMKAKYGTNINTFILKAYLKENELEEKYFVIRTNNKNQTFSIEFLDDNDNKKDIEKLKVYENENSIEKNNYNEFKIEIIKTERIAQMHLEHYRDLSIEYPEIAYNNYLDKDYREKRFGTLENYKKYIEDNKNELEYVQITKYFVESESNETKYVCLDQYENTYTFSENATMQYSVLLDTYTLTTENFIETYKNANDTERVQLNVDKFIKMMNSHDYINIYKYLSEGFKENYFKTESEFEEYIKSIFYRYNKVTYKDITKKGSDIYIANIQIEDFLGESDEIKDFNIIIQLIDETEFVMSFGMN